MTRMTPCPKCQCVVEVPDAICDVCGYDVAEGRQQQPVGTNVALVLAGLVIGLLASSLIVYIGKF